LGESLSLRHQLMQITPSDRLPSLRRRLAAIGIALLLDATFS
jgi:hypothetical protein